MEVKANGFGAGYNVYRLTAAQIPLCKNIREESWRRAMVLSSHLVDDVESPRLGMIVTAPRLSEGSDAFLDLPVRQRPLKLLDTASVPVQHQQVCQAK